MILKELLSLVVIDDIGLGLIHFIWQALVIAGITSAVLFLSKSASARTRYFICFISLLLMIIVPSATTLLDLYYNHNDFSITTSQEFLPIQVKEVIIDGKYYGNQHRGNEIHSKPNEEIMKHLGAYMPFLTIAWLLGVLAISMYHIFGFLKLRRLVKQTRQSLEFIWEARILKLITRLNIKHKIQISKLPGLETPVVIGCLKPVLLFPISFFTGMSDEYIEAIILHELAHIKRFDYLLNMIQVIIEILGFFHPAVWWLSKKIREERENCCDDIAINTLGNRLIYVKSLVQLEECRDNHRLLVAANGSSLFNRVARILESKRNNTSASISISGFVISFLCLFVLMGFIWKHNGNIWNKVDNQMANESLVRNISQKLVGFYPFNGNANDESGFKQNGVVYDASLSEDRLGRAERAFDFNGKNSHIVIPVPTALNTSGSITISCWIYPRRCNKYESWISKLNSDSWTSQWRVGFGENKNHEWGLTECKSINKQDIWNDYWVANGSIPLNQWTQVVMVANQKSGFVFLYLNGKRVIQFDQLKSFEKSYAPLFIGVQKDDGKFFNGKIDDIRIYNCALNDQEVNAVYNLN